MSIEICQTKIPRRQDGSTECEHLREEHEGFDGDGACEFDECEGFTQGGFAGSDDDDDLD